MFIEFVRDVVNHILEFLNEIMKFEITLVSLAMLAYNGIMYGAIVQTYRYAIQYRYIVQRDTFPVVKVVCSSPQHSFSTNLPRLTCGTGTYR